MHYYCTAGRGTEKFAAEEIISKLAVKDIQIVDGKVFFSCSDDQFGRIYSLKSVERVFVQVLSCREPINQVVKVTIQDVGRYIMNKELWTLPGLQTVIADICCVNTGDIRDGTGCSPSKKKRRSSDGVKFRVSCKCTGRVGRKIQAQRLSRYLGQGLRRLIGWSVELRDPDIEVCVHLNDDGLTVGIPLQRVPLSKRGYIKHYGLRSTVAWIMTHLLHIKPGDTVVDPLCGKATLLQEASVQHQCYAQYLGVDNDSGQLAHAGQNLDQIGIQNNIQLLRGDATRLPMQSCSVDGVVTDAPFGQKFVPDSDLKLFYEAILTEISRILKPHGRVVLLTSQVLCTWLVKRFSRLTGQVIPANIANGGELAKSADGPNKSELVVPHNRSHDRELVIPVDNQKHHKLVILPDKETEYEQVRPHQCETVALPTATPTMTDTTRNGTGASAKTITNKADTDKTEMMTSQQESFVSPKFEDTVLKNEISLGLECHTGKISSDPEQNRARLSTNSDDPSVTCASDFGESRPINQSSRHNAAFSVHHIVYEQPKVHSKQDPWESNNGNTSDIKISVDSDCEGVYNDCKGVRNKTLPVGDCAETVDIPEPAGDNLAPTVDTVVPRGNTLVPTGDILVPAGDTVVPARHTLVPTGDVVVHTGDVLVPREDTLIHKGNTVVAAEDTLVSTGDILLPIADTLAPSGDIPVKSGQDHVNSEDLVLLESHYVKLGETDACICIFMKE